MSNNNWNVDKLAYLEPSVRKWNFDFDSPITNHKRRGGGGGGVGGGVIVFF